MSERPEEALEWLSPLDKYINAKVRSKYLHLRQIKKLPKPAVFTVETERDCFELGIIRWHGPWRQYVFTPTVEAVYSRGYLLDLAMFIETAEAARKIKPIEEEPHERVDPLVR